jgi:hypothetical protein
MADAPRPFDRRDWMRDLLSEERDRALVQELIRRGALKPSDRDQAVRLQAEGGEPRPSLEDVLRRAGSVDPAALDEALRAVAAEEFSRLGSAQGLALPPEAAEAAEDPAKRLGDYILAAPLGRGGAGEVWKAWDRRLSRWVAVKIANGPAPSKDAWERFRRESLAAGRLSHPGIVPVHDEGQSGGRPYIVMQYVEGETLDRRRLSLREALEAAWTVATALQHAHGWAPRRTCPPSRPGARGRRTIRPSTSTAWARPCTTS